MESESRDRFQQPIVRHAEPVRPARWAADEAAPANVTLRNPLPG